LMFFLSFKTKTNNKKKYKTSTKDEKGDRREKKKLIKGNIN